MPNWKVGKTKQLIKKCHTVEETSLYSCLATVMHTTKTRLTLGVEKHGGSGVPVYGRRWKVDAVAIHVALQHQFLIRNMKK